MKNKRTTQSFLLLLLLSLLHILLCVSLQVGVTAEARFRHPGVATLKRGPVGPSQSCGASSGRSGKPCRQVRPRPPRLP
ncbi:unnamed protein product [Eruca vesicaria subsp. sativa]|uniref:Transmembrane protein n=1 Tax=Eruca vesicaria subsp. sativa TaxID=29727 RepID=A0ABC8K0F7_ERUVS|nr:unnamed protein product [Eruca vesicaria subsp. sativa]